LATKRLHLGFEIEPRQDRLEYSGYVQLHPQRSSGVFSQKIPHAYAVAEIG
jgi:hypothetical protein